MGTTFLADIPGPQPHSAHVELVALGTADEKIVFRAPFKCKITRASFIPDAAVTGDNTNNFILQLRNKELDGTGTVAVTAAKTYATGVDIAAFDEDSLGAIQTASDADILEEGEVLALNKTETGAGLELPQGQIYIEYEAAEN
jgi:hypothetical protein